MSSLPAEYKTQQARCIYIVQVQFGYTEHHPEFLPEEVELTEFVVEELAAHILLTFFDSAMIDEVTNTRFSDAKAGTGQHKVSLYARCPHHAFPSSPDEVEMTEYKLEQTLGIALLEFFDTVEVERVEVRFIPAEQ